jgi:MFS transporter, DHA2 family, multidrug resistance protein
MMDSDLPAKYRHWAVLAILMGTFLSNLDGAIANIALPIISQELKASASDTIWVVNAYQLVLAITILPLAAMGERIGYKKIFLSGIFVFMIGSFACYEADSIEHLIFARVLQGLGGGGLATMGPALIRYVFPAHLTSRGIALLGHFFLRRTFRCSPCFGDEQLAMVFWHQHPFRACHFRYRLLYCPKKYAHL